MDSLPCRCQFVWMRKAESSKTTPLGPTVTAYIVTSLDTYVGHGASAATQIETAVGELPAEIVSDASAVLAGKGGLSYRDGLLIQLAWGLVGPEGYDHTQRGEGARTVGQALGKANAARHIPKINDAYENIGKNSANLARGNVDEFDRLLKWMNSADRQQRELLFKFSAATISLTSRPVLPMPKLRPVELTFGRVIFLLDELLLTPSGGAHEQFAVAAFLGALIDQFGFGGVGALNVRTKNINASDASSGTAGDVQVMRGNMFEEIFEVSANDWHQKLEQSIQAARKAGLPRAHVLAQAADTTDLVSALAGQTVDVSVIGVSSFLRTVTAILRPPAREDALRRLYDYIDNLQPNVNLTNGFVELLRRHAFTTE